MEERTKGLNGNQLKLIAMASMTLDHIVCVVWPNYPRVWWIIALHVIGRLAAPTFWFMAAEGYHHTHNIKKYLLRLGVFAVISHFAYNFAFGIPFVPFRTTPFNQTSVIWPLLLGVIALWVGEHEGLKQWQKMLIIFGLAMLAFPGDWSSIAVLAVMEIGLNRGNFKKQMWGMMKWVALYVLIFVLFIDPVYGLLQFGVALVIPLLRQYNGERGRCRSLKHVFYWYYPVHLVLCGLLRLALHGNISTMIGG